MAVTTTTIMPASVVTAYTKDFLFFQDLETTWAKMFYANMRKEVVGGRELRGKTIQVPIYTGMPEVTDHLTESSDVTPVSMQDAYTSITIYEEGNVLQNTRFLENIAAYTDVGAVAARMIGKNMAVRRDKIIRNAIVFNVTDTVYCGAATTRATLDASADKITYDNIVEAVARARGRGIPPLSDGTYFTIYHPCLERDLVALSQFAYPAYYGPNVEMLMSGDMTNVMGKKLPGEKYRFGSLRFIESQYGKVFCGAGTPTQGATTSTAAVAAGDTVINVANATGLAVGNWITVGTVESSTTAVPATENVLITAVNTLALSIRGAGADGDANDVGFKFAHGSGAAVVEAPNVCALPILGPESAIIAFAADVGWEGEVSLEWAPTQLPRRFLNHAWYWVGGAKLIDKNCVQIECATTGNFYGNN